MPRSKDARRGLWIDPEACPHLEWDPTVTVWPGENFERLTWTCMNCGRVRGRATGNVNTRKRT